MNGKYLLDTNIVIALFANDASVVTNLQNANEVFVPTAVIGELYYGAQKSNRPAENSNRIQDFVLKNAILNITSETAHFYGNVKNKLRKKGKPIPENDIWIAATALQHNLTLVTRDNHFNEVEGLNIEVW